MSTLSFSVTQLFFAGSLYFVWGLVEGLQIIEVMGLFHSKVPANVANFLESFAGLASFNFINLTPIIDSALYLPEVDALTLNY